MVATPSVMLPLGTKAPSFQLPEVVSGKTITLESFAGKPALLVMFISRHCPYVQHIKQELARIGEDYGTRAGIVAICANDVANYPADAPSSLKEMAEETGLRFPICYDESQAVAKAFCAACTPDFFVFDQTRKLAYRGQLDDSRPGNGKKTNGADLRAALDSVISGRAPDEEQKPSLGCNIKWKPGNTPPYFR